MPTIRHLIWTLGLVLTGRSLLNRHSGEGREAIALFRAVDPQVVVVGNSLVRSYQDLLCNYLTENGMHYVDYSGDRDIMRCHYAFGSHLNHEGAILFTEKVKKEIKKILIQMSGKGSNKKMKKILERNVSL